ncbi:MAG: NAD-dependent deacylase [Planctomycetota bacterium]
MPAEVSRKNVVVFTGAGMSAESGLQTFRGNGGLWEGHRVEDVATPEAWAKDPVLVLEFYNKRRRKVRAAQPNAAHRALVDLESAYDVRIVTQNVDDLHERAGSMHVLHLHGEVLYARSTRDPSHTQYLGDTDIALGDTCPLGSQLRPHIVWFGEIVPAMDKAARIVSQADIFICVGTSLQVYPANSLIDAAPRHTRRIVVNPEVPDLVPGDICECIAKTACEGVPELVANLLR